MTNTQKIVPFLWFNHEAEEAVNFYASLFKDSKIGTVVRYGEEGAGAKGAVMTIEFQLNGQEFIALNGGPEFKFTEALSLFIKCETQEEVDHLWDKLSEGGEKSQCGWLKDKYGLSWQVVPTALLKMMRDKDPQRAKRVMEAMMKMSKIEVSVLEEAYNAQAAHA
ncbi:VOC family protein [Xanthocytophaga flava]|uniref:VOC family protein n=1 Tax=Xanthocytophaga flava TaxID=3048013 RepID=UPI0028D2F67B|nr:VOC family protein [Xanthocytophaga flavus]MDJ1467227.1 VOC family protein [Xanthocytophaga flavus]